MRTNAIILAAVLIAQFAPTAARAQDIDQLLLNRENIPMVADTYHLDSICTTLKDGTPYGKSLMTYDADGMLFREEHYVCQKDACELYLVKETTERDGITGLPLETVTSQPDGQGTLRQVLKEVTCSYHGREAERTDIYQWREDGWHLYGKTRVSFDRDGNKTAEVTDFTAYGVAYRKVINREFDSRGSVTMSVASTLRNGYTLYASETRYWNTYDAADLLMQTIADVTGGEDLVSRYYWSDGTVTAISSPRQQPASESTDGYYDLTGCRHNGQPTGHGLYIVGGKKVRY